MTTMIETRQLTRKFKKTVAVDQLDLAIAEGELFGFIGPNGAGKTTTIRMITGFLPPSDGRVTVNGHDLFTEPGRARREIGYLPETVALYGEMRVGEYLRYRARLEGMSRAEARDALPATVESCLLQDVEHQIIGTLSKGYRQRVGLAAAILHGPRVLVLDEPTVGLDPKQIIAIRELIRDLGRERTLLISTHILPEVEQLCQRVLIIDRGRLVAEGTPSELREQSHGHSLLKVTVRDAPADAADALGQIPGVESVTAENGAPDAVALHREAGEGLDLDQGTRRFQLECGVGADPREAVFRAAVERGWVLLELAEVKASLEDVFVRLTGRDADAAAPEVGRRQVPAAGEPEEPEAAGRREENAAGDGGEVAS